MGGFFSYDNPIMELLMKIGDLIILNFLFLVCSLPIFTIGASYAGLYTAMKVMADKEDDSSLVDAFFRGFKTGFKTITIAWNVLLVITALVGAASMLAYGYYGLNGWLCLLPVAICAWYLAQIPAFHSRFGCTVTQLIRNVWFLIIAHPLRTLGVAIMTWLPMVLFLGDLYTFMSMVPIWCTLYFGTTISFCFGFLKKPFNTLIDHFNKTHTPEGDPLPEGEADALPEAEAEDYEDEEELCEEDDAEDASEEATEEAEPEEAPVEA